MKVVFLDMDGVVNNLASMYEGVHILHEKVLLIDHLCERMDAVIVISSSWRILYSLKNLQEILYRSGMGRAKIIGMTPKEGATGEDPNQLRRGGQIQKWLDDTDEDIEAYVILDDDGDMLESQMDNFVKTDMRSGITYRDTLKAEGILGGNNA